MEENKNILTDNELDSVVEMAEKSTPEEVINMRASIDKAEEISKESNDDFSEEIKNVSLDSSYEELLAGELKDLPISKADIFEAAKVMDEISDEDIEERIKDQTAGLFDLSDEDMISFLATISKFRKKEVTNVYQELPESVKNIIKEFAVSQGLPFSEYPRIAKMFVEQIVSQAELDETFIDIEKSIDETLKMPTMADLYSEHTKRTMDEKIPEFIEKVRAENPEGAELLEKIRENFYTSYKLDDLKEHYETNSRTRKLIRRDWDNPIRFCDEINVKNHRSKFKMPDCRSISPALDHVFLKENHDPESRIAQMNITEEDVSKFMILFCRTFMNIDPDNVVDAAHIYYALKNITMLNLTNETKTSFAAELINNICDIIEFIREKEAEFNASNRHNKRRNK